VLRDLTGADSDAYYELIGRNRDHLHRHGDYSQESKASRDWVMAYFADPTDDNIRFGIWIGTRLIGRVDLNPVNPVNPGSGQPG
jgi:hypothetical protein